MKCKVLHITQSLGGVETHLKLLFENTNPDQFTHILVLPNEANQSMLDFCVKHQIQTKQITFKRGIHLIFDLTAFFWLMLYTIKFKPDIIHLHSSKAGLIGRIVAKICFKPSVFTPHGISYLSMKGFKRMIFFSIECIAKFFTKHIIAVSQSEYLRLVFELGFKENQITVVKNCPPDKVIDVPKNSELIKSPKIKIGTIARITYQKNPLLFLEVVKKTIEINQNVHFYYLGAGLHDHLIKEFNEYISQHQLAENITILPWGSMPIQEFYATLDMFVLTSVFEAGLPYVVVEAMNQKVPCITSKCDGCIDGIEHGNNGYLCMIADEFVKCINKLCVDEKLRIQMGLNGFESLKINYNLKKNIGILEDLYTRISS